jgi:hypothetical protein
MKNIHHNRYVWLSVLGGIWSAFFVASVHSASTPSAKVDLDGSRMALMPFIVGQLESPDAMSPKPLSKPLDQIEVEFGGVPEGSDQTMNRIVSQALRKRYPDSMIPFDSVTAAHREISDDPTLDTTRKQAVRLGEMLQADIVVVGTLWRFRQKGALEEGGAEGMPDRSASVGLALYLVDVKTGARLWRGFFDGTQKALTEDVLGGIKQIGMGLRWLTVEELAQNGVQSLLQKLSRELQARPAAN